MRLRIAAAALAIGLCTAGVAQADDQPQAGSSTSSCRGTARRPVVLSPT